MARQIKLSQISDYTRGQISILIRAATLEADRRLKLLTPVDTGRLRENWQTEIQELSGSVYNNLPYAAPVIAGKNYPPSWGGRYRSRQNAKPFLAIVQKDIQTYVEAEANRIAQSS